MTLFLLECIARVCGLGSEGALISEGVRIVTRFGEEEFALFSYGGVVAPTEELSVDDDFAVGTVPFEALDPFESCEFASAPESDSLRKSRERLRSSLKSLRKAGIFASRYR